MFESLRKHVLGQYGEEPNTEAKQGPRDVIAGNDARRAEEIDAASHARLYITA